MAHVVSKKKWHCAQPIGTNPEFPLSNGFKGANASARTDGDANVALENVSAIVSIFGKAIARPLRGAA